MKSDKNGNTADGDLLTRFLREGSDDAFRALVERHHAMVYNACRRGLGGDAGLAEDAAQAVFIILAQKAATIRRRGALAGWLFRTASFVTADMRKAAARRKRREQEAVAMADTERDERFELSWWTGMGTAVNEAIAGLREVYRDALVLHFLEGRSQRAVGDALGCTEEAARKRIARGLSKLKTRLVKLGVGPSVAGLAAYLSAESAQAAPAGFAGACQAAAVGSLSGLASMSSAPALLAKSGLKMMFWARAKVYACLIAAVAVTGAGVPAVVRALNPTPLPAFPGAEGHGALAVGGRGGEVVFVTNLNNSGPGSFREAMLTPRPRIVVFRVAGTIFLKSFVDLRADQSYVTVAGQTAPGLGVCLAGCPIRVLSGFHDGVFRYLRSRIGTNGHWRATTPEDARWCEMKDKSQMPTQVLDNWANLDAFLIWGQKSYVSDVIVDHCSFSWAIDATVGTYNYVKNVTFQWNLMAEGSLIGHVEAGHNFGPILGSGHDYGRSQPLSFHHNYLAHHRYRAPQVCHLDIHHINNVSYNNAWDDFTIGSLHQEVRPEADIVGNTFKQGPNHSAARYWGVKFHYRGGVAYLADNRVLDIRGAPVPTCDPAEPWSVVKGGTSNALYAIRRSSRLPQPPVPVTVHTAEEACELVLAGAGATRPARDPVDARLVADFRNGTGAFGIRSDYPDLCPGGACEPYPDADRDGMDDRWERRHGLNPADPADGPLDKDRDGYTNVEEFLNETAPGRRE